jgi:hypothetical protein
MTGVTYDSGALIAAERSERRMWARHRALLLRRVVPTVPAPVIAQCWRGTPRQAQLARFLTGCGTETLDDTRARATGTLAGRARAADNGWGIERIIQHGSWEYGNTSAVTEATARAQAQAPASQANR